MASRRAGWVAALIVLGALSGADAQSPGQVFKDCADCPEMVVVPFGTFQMGTANLQSASLRSAFTDDVASYETPQHQVRIGRAFALGRFEVTQAQWMAVMGNNPSAFMGPTRPVEGVSWNDAQEFIAKLNAMTGKRYRLPSEAEWEYAARGGNPARYAFGDNEASLGNYAWFKDNSAGATHPVGQKFPNQFGLYDMAGNVWEWVEDCYRDSYVGAPTDGSAIESAGCRRVVKGGSWFGAAVNERPADRGSFPPEGLDVTLGFRLARDL